MSSDLYLIAHKVRGEPAFDIATKMQCPLCEGDGKISNGIIDITGDDGIKPCYECDNNGFWWIIPTSGHRAYPFMNWELDMLVHYTGDGWHPNVLTEAGPLALHPLWDTTPDHYRTVAAPEVIRQRLEDLIATLPPRPVYRRF